MTAYSVQVFSDWTDAFSTEFKVAFKDIDNLQDPLGGNEFAQMDSPPRERFGSPHLGRTCFGMRTS